METVILTGIARCLAQHHLLDEATLLESQQTAKKQNAPFLAFLVKQNLLSAIQIAQALASDFSLPFFDLNSYDSQYSPKIMEVEVIKKHQLLPLFIRDNTLFLALADPTRIEIFNELRFNTGLTIAPIVVELDKLQHLIHKIFNTPPSDSSILTRIEELIHTDLASIDINEPATEYEVAEQEEIAAKDVPLVRFVNKIIIDAIHSHASDIHFEPYEHEFRIRYRNDGVLYEITKPPVKLAGRLVARLKVMAGLDTSERRLPQDGRFKISLSSKHAVDFRINTCPTLFGEKVVLRVLDPTIAAIGIDALGFLPEQKKIFEENIKRSQGMILVTGPTGSGKTVTQYTALNILNDAEKNISTVEDPVEIYLAGINQVSVNSKTGLNFSTALRAFLRQDPDIIMVGEIRDTETAEIAIKAAQTGHLVFSTLHTNNAAETLTRLINMKVAPFNIATSVCLVIAQRLVRRLCERCKQKYLLTQEVLIQAGFDEAELPDITLYQAKGCQYCINGYKGRIGIYEVLTVNKDIQHIIMGDGNSLAIEACAIKQGMVSLRRAALLKVKIGLTSLEEINTLTYH